MQSECEKRQGGNVALGWGMRKKQMLQKKDLQREGLSLKPRRGSSRSSCLLRHKCDRAPPGPVKTLRIKCIREHSHSLHLFLIFFHLISIFFKYETEGNINSELFF